MKTALTIAGSDSSGGAGIQADVKTMTAHGVFALCAVTALTAQNTTGVYDVMESTPGFLARQIDCIFEDIRPDAVKTGMLSSAPLIEVISERLRAHRAEHIVVDPVMVATSGSSLMASGALDALLNRLIPLAELITPNIPEAEVLSGMRIHSKQEAELCARILSERCGCSVLIKGGHEVNTADDYLLHQGCGVWFHGQRIDNPNTHGTGCTLSSAIASNLAKGYALEEAVLRAKEYISGSLNAMLNLGKGSGPLNHMFDLTSRYI